MRVTILAYADNESSEEFDVVVGQVAAALRKGGHRVSILSVHGNVGKLITGLKRRKPDLVFNLMEQFTEDLSSDIGAVGLLDLLGVPYTGGGPGEFYLRQDKALAKKLLSFDNIRYPDFAVFSQDAGLETGGNLRMPLFVKPLRADASIGINGRSLVRTSDELMKRVNAIHKEVHDAALAEEFIEGREFYVGVLGNVEPKAFPPIEIDFTGFPADKPKILDVRAKFAEGTPEYEGTKAVLADIPDELRAKLHQVSLNAYRALRVRDYGRVDLRFTESGDIYVIEVNASCYLEQSSEFARAAEAVGLDYVTLINRIVELAAERGERRKVKRLV
jgi:D-alanine-D-alanine ligase